MKSKAHFITASIFGKSIKTVQVDMGTMDYYMRLTTLYGQFRAIGVNYNQVVKLLYSHLSEKKQLHISLNLKNKLLNWLKYVTK